MIWEIAPLMTQYAIHAFFEAYRFEITNKKNLEVLGYGE